MHAVFGVGGSAPLCEACSNDIHQTTAAQQHIKTIVSEPTDSIKHSCRLLWGILIAAIQSQIQLKSEEVVALLSLSPVFLCAVVVLL